MPRNVGKSTGGSASGNSPTPWRFPEAAAGTACKEEEVGISFLEESDGHAIVAGVEIGHFR